MNEAEKKVVVADELAKWKAALMNELTGAGLVATYHALNTSGCRMAQITVHRPAYPDERYKIDFQHGITTKGTWAKANVQRTACCIVECHSGKRTLRYKGFTQVKVGAVVQNACQWIDARIQRDINVEAKRKRSDAARAIWADAKIELPDWMGVLANTDTDADVGTFHVRFSEHRDNYAMKRLTPSQIARIAGYIVGVCSEPPIEAFEKELVTKLLQHEGKLP